MNLKKVTLDNFGPHEHYVFVPAEYGITSIKGENGAGKSTLINAFAWSLFGTKFHGVRNNQYIREGTSPKTHKVGVESVFDFGNRRIRIDRRITNDAGVCSCNVYATDLDAEKPKEKLVAGPAVSHAEKYISNLLGLDFKGFYTAVFVQQKQVDQIVSATARERAKVIEKMMGIEASTEALNFAKEASKELQKAADIIQPGELEDEEKAYLEQEKKVEETKKQLKKARDKKEKGEKAYKKISEAFKKEEKKRDYVKTLKDKVDNVFRLYQEKKKDMRQTTKLLEEHQVEKKKLFPKDVLEQKIQEAEKQKEDLSNQRSDLSHIIKTADSILKKPCKIIKEDKKKEVLDSLKIREDRLKQVVETRVLLKGQIKDLSNVLKILDTGQEAICPLCGGELTADHKDQKRKEEKDLKEKIEKVEEEENQLKKDINKLKEMSSFIENQEKLKEEQEEESEKRTEAVKKIAEVQTSLDVLLAKEKVLREQMNEIIKQTESEKIRKSLEDNLVVLSKELNDLEKESTELEEDYKNKKAKLRDNFTEFRDKTEKAEKEYDKLKSDLIVTEGLLDLEEEKAKLYKKSYEKAKKAHEKYKDLTHNLSVTNLTLKSLEDFKKIRTETSLPALSDLASDFLSRFTEGKFTELILDNDFDISVKTDTGQDRTVSQLSGGEMSAVAIALRLAISVYLTQNKNSLLILDEILVSMTENRSERILETIQMTCKDSQIILIAHNDSLDRVADKIIAL